MPEHRLRARIIFVLFIYGLLLAGVCLIALPALYPWQKVLFLVLLATLQLVSQYVGEIHERRCRLLQEVESFGAPRDYDEMRDLRDPASGRYHI
jgi:hypothetical protein